MAGRPQSTPTFVLPYKRYASTDLLQLAKRYLDEHELSLRTATSQGAANQRIVYADHPKAAALSHTTLARWITFAGAMTVSLAVGCQLFLEAYPDSSIHRFAGPVDPRKARSPDRLKILSIRQTLKRSEYADIVNRISVRYQLRPLTKEQTRRYIDHQVVQHGGDCKIFDESVKDLIHDFTAGVPRSINNVAIACLLGATARRSVRIDEEAFHLAANEMHWN